MNHALPRWSFAVPLVFIAIGSTGCATPRDRAGAIVAAATSGHLRPVVACWEKEYETSGFQGEYIAIVDFEISASEHFRNARVISVESVDKTNPTPDMTVFRECVEKALDEVELPTENDAGGPGYSAFIGVSVHNYRISFRGDQEGHRQEAGGRQANILIGPRADRCQGMYTYKPPRDTSTLFTEISVAQSKPAPAQDKDAQARELQRMYDMQLELVARLEMDLTNRTLPAVNRKRLEDALETARSEIVRIAERIGCGATRTAK
jgi:hypothetical protein